MISTARNPNNILLVFNFILKKPRVYMEEDA